MRGSVVILRNQKESASKKSLGNSDLDECHVFHVALSSL